MKKNEVITKDKKLFGMIHVKALPGTPLNNLKFDEILELALKEAETYSKYNFDGVIIENMWDVPYMKREVGPEIVSAMSIICYNIKNKFFKDKLVGVQILAGCNKASLAVALTSGCDFIRAEGFVFGHVADEGIFEADCGELMRYRKNIGADYIKVFTDIKKKHSSHSITSDVNIVDMCINAEYFLSDGMIITGNSTGKEVDDNELIEISKSKLKVPVLIGSGLTSENIRDFYYLADYFIVGSYFKKDGLWSNDLDEERIIKFKTAYDILNKK